MYVHSPLLRGTPGRVEVPIHLHTSLKRLAASTHCRGPRGWTQEKTAEADVSGRTSERRRPGLIPADHISQLALRNLCKVRPGNGRRAVDRAELTDLGREVAAMVSRSRQEAGH